MAVPSIETSNSRDRTVVDGLIVGAVILGIAGALIVGRHAVQDDRADASERTATTTTVPAGLAPATTKLWAGGVLGNDGLPAGVRVTIARNGRDLIGGTVSIDGVPCKVGVSVRAGQERSVECPLATKSGAGFTVRVTDERGTDESLVVR